MLVTLYKLVALQATAKFWIEFDSLNCHFNNLINFVCSILNVNSLTGILKAEHAKD